MPDKIKFALIGAKHPHAALHVRTLQLMEEVDSIILCDDDPDAARVLQAKSPEKVEADPASLDELLRREDVRFVFGCLPTDENGPAVLRALQAGKHVMSEKPVGISSGVISELVREAAARRLTLSVCYQNRYHPISQDMRNFLGDGVIGSVMNAEIRMITSQVKFRNPKHWLFQRKRSGGGILSWLMCHYFDLLRYLLRDEIVEVSAITGTLNGEAIDVEDTASGSLRFQKGALGSFNAGYLLSRSPSGYLAGAYDTYVGFKGREGSLTWVTGSGADRLRVESVSASWNPSAPVKTIEYTMDPGEGYGGAMGLRFLRDFIRAALHGEQAPTTGADALAVARIVEACYKSSETGQRIRL